MKAAMKGKQAGLGPCPFYNRVQVTIMWNLGKVAVSSVKADPTYLESHKKAPHLSSSDVFCNCKVAAPFL